MFDKLDLESKGYAIVAGFISLAVVYWLISDKLAVWSTAAPAVLIMLAYFVLNPVYILLIVSLTKWKQWKGLVAALFITLASDIISIPHYLSFRLITLPQDASSYFSAEFALFKAMSIIHTWGAGATFIIYVLIPSLFVLIACEIVGIKVVSRIIKEKIGN